MSTSELERIVELYNEGKFEQAGELANQLANESVGDLDTRNAALVQLGWCNYKRGLFREAASVARLADSRAAKLLIYQSMSYKPELFYTEADQAERRQIKEDLQGEPAVLNGDLIARLKEVGQTDEPEPLLELAEAFIFKREDCTDRVRGHIVVNAAKLASARGKLKIALTYFPYAQEAYGVEGNFDHRAAAYFWESKVYESLNEYSKAVRSQSDSVELWEKAVENAPENPTFKTRLADAQKRLAELSSKA